MYSSYSIKYVKFLKNEVKSTNFDIIFTKDINENCIDRKKRQRKNNKLDDCLRVLFWVWFYEVAKRKLDLLKILCVDNWYGCIQITNYIWGIYDIFNSMYAKINYINKNKRKRKKIYL